MHWCNDETQMLLAFLSGGQQGLSLFFYRLSLWIRKRPDCCAQHCSAHSEQGTHPKHCKEGTGNSTESVSANGTSEQQPHCSTL